MDYVGVLAVEFFVLENDDLVINVTFSPSQQGHGTPMPAPQAS